jgi:Ca2+-binding EF-hand superfamily protein
MEMTDEQAAEYIKDFDNNGNGKIEFSGMSEYTLDLCLKKP